MANIEAVQKKRTFMLLDFRPKKCSKPTISFRNSDLDAETQKYITGNLGTNEGTRAAETLLVKFSRLPPIIKVSV